MNSPAKSWSRDGTQQRSYDDLLEGHFDVEVIRIERSEDKQDLSGQIETDIYGKAFDFSSKTIQELRMEGEDDARRQLKDLSPSDF